MLPHQGWRTQSVLLYLPIAGGRLTGFIPFPRVLVLCEMQSISSRIWTRVVVSISNDDKHYTTGTSNLILGFMQILCSEDIPFWAIERTVTFPKKDVKMYLWFSLIEKSKVSGNFQFVFWIWAAARGDSLMPSRRLRQTCALMARSRGKDLPVQAVTTKWKWTSFLLGPISLIF